MYFLATANEPTIATTSQLTGTSFMVIMVDLDIPSTTNPHTFLHWVQTDLTPSTAASAVAAASNATSATTQAFTLNNTKGTAALVPYTQPNPPAQNPLSHRYTQVLVDTSALSATALATIQAAVQSKVGFDVATVLQNAGLTANVVAGNSFNVTNAGPATSGNANAGTGAGAGAAAANGTAAASPSTATQGGGKKGQKGNKTRTGAGAAQATGADGNGNGNGKGKGSGNAQATKSGGGGGNKGNKPTSTASAGASGLPAATGATVNNNLTNSGASGRNGTGTVTTSGAMSGYGLGGLVVTPVLAALLGAVVYAL